MCLLHSISTYYKTTSHPELHQQSIRRKPLTDFSVTEHYFYLQYTTDKDAIWGKWLRIQHYRNKVLEISCQTEHADLIKHHQSRTATAPNVSIRGKGEITCKTVSRYQLRCNNEIPVSPIVKQQYTFAIFQIQTVLSVRHSINRIN